MPAPEHDGTSSGVLVAGLASSSTRDEMAAVLLHHHTAGHPGGTSAGTWATHDLSRGS